MSFCKEVKNELADQKTLGAVSAALCYGFMLFGRAFSYKKICMQTSNPDMAQLYCRLIKREYGVDCEISIGGEKRPTYKAWIESPADRLKILATVDFAATDTAVNYEVLYNEACEIAFIRGAFFACGNISDPEKEYRADFLVRNEYLADELSELLLKHGIAVKRSARGKASVLYVKESGIIEDLLTLLGASKKSLDIMDAKIMKSVKNKINRERNCDNANISKTVEASVNQRMAIEYLEKVDRLYSLPEELLSVALLRKNNPEATLKELCSLSDTKITVSGLNHRLRKIVEIYNELKK